MTEKNLNKYMPKDPLKAGAWAGSLRYALGRADVMASFRADTGNTWEPSKSPIDQMIDKATGMDFDFIKAFAKWHNENIWGEEEGQPVDGPGASSRE